MQHVMVCDDPIHLCIRVYTFHQDVIVNEDVRNVITISIPLDIPDDLY